MPEEVTRQWDDSLISMGLGALVVVVSGILLYNYFNNQAPKLLKSQNVKASPSAQVVAQKTDEPKQNTTPADQSSGSNTLPTKHTIARGETLSSLSQKYYGTPYQWKKIADANKIVNASQLSIGQAVEIPKVELISASSTVRATNAPAATQIAQATVAPTASAKAVVAASATPTAKAVAQATVAPSMTPKAVAQATVQPSPVAPVQSGAQVASATTGNITYTVVHGDSLWKIAQAQCGTGYAWTAISNQNKLVHPNVIHAGNVLTFTCSK